jgi:L-lactate dehydrogenase complex protein LldF
LGRDHRGLVIVIRTRRADKRVTACEIQLGEEIGLPDALAHAGSSGSKPIWPNISSTTNEPPSHTVWPAMHRTREQVAELFNEDHKLPPAADDPASMVKCGACYAKNRGDVGISGANFLLPIPARPAP